MIETKSQRDARLKREGVKPDVKLLQQKLVKQLSPGDGTPKVAGSTPAARNRRVAQSRVAPQAPDTGERSGSGLNQGTAAGGETPPDPKPFDRTAYMRQYMKDRRAAAKAAQ